MTCRLITDDEDDLEESYAASNELLLEPRDPYALRSLPHRIGTGAFLSEDDIGLREIVSEDEGDGGGLYDTEDEEEDNDEQTSKRSANNVRTIIELFKSYRRTAFKAGSQYDAEAYVVSVASSLIHNNYDAGAYVASVASSLVHNMMLELT